MNNLLSRAAAIDPKYNPKDSYRPGQKAAVLSLWGAIHNGYKILALDASTGSGKSIIATIVGNLLGNSDILTTQIKLQNQYLGLGPEYEKVEGRRNFPCIAAYNRKQADRGECITGSDDFICSYKPVAGGRYPAYGEKGWRSEDPKKRCEYWQNVERGVNSQHTIFNYAYYTLKKNLPQCEFGRKFLQILDEGHNLESYLREVNSFEIHDLGLYHVRYIPGVDTIEYEDFDQIPMKLIKDKEKAIEWLRELMEIVSFRINDTAIARENQRDGLKRRYQMLNSLEGKISKLISDYDKAPDNWVVALEEDGFKMIPLYVGEYTYYTLLRHSDIAIIMSATLPRKEVLCKRLGIPIKDMFYYHMDSTFPPENAKIYSYPQPVMSWEPGGMGPKRNVMGKIIGGLFNTYPKVRGLILCNSFEEVKHYNNYIREKFPEQWHRVIAHNRGDNVEYLLDDHQGIENGVIITPSMWEGQDFYDDKARFLGIAKIPFEDTKDVVVKGWMERDKARYFQNACQKLIQGVGRVVRSPEDYADIHILDGAFRRLYKYNLKEFPEEIQERVIYI